MKGSSYVVVECPVVIFFLQNYVLKYSSCCRVAPFCCFSDDLPVKRESGGFKFMVQPQNFQRGFAHDWLRIWLGHCFAIDQVNAFGDFLEMLHFHHENVFEYFADDALIVCPLNRF